MAMTRLKRAIEKTYYQRISLLSRKIDRKWSLLDVGCGYSSSIRLMGKGSYTVGLDYKPFYLLTSKKSRIHDDYVLGEVCTLPFKAACFDCAIAIEVLEHLPKPDGLKMITEMERVAKQVILTTPNGFLPTYPGPNDSPDEKHLCGWTVDELRKVGFKVYGFGGLKLLWVVKSGRATLRQPKWLFLVLAAISELFVYRYPSLAFQLVGVKPLTKPT